VSINIHVRNLSLDSSEEDLRGLFAAYGDVESARVVVDRFTNRSRGFGFIQMAKREEGLKAIQELDSKDLLGRSLKVSEARPKFNARRCGRSGGKSSW